MIRRILPTLSLVLPVLVLSACGDAGLTARGLVEVTTDDATRRFDFANETRLDGTSPGRFTGTCQLRRTRDADGAPQWGAVVQILSGGGSPDDDTPLTRITIMQSSGALPEAGLVEAELGGSVFRSIEGGCSVEMPYALQDGVVGLLAECDVAEAARTAHVSLELDVAGCDVEN